MINLIRQATWMATYFELNKISSSKGFLYFGLHRTKVSSEVSCE
jgi:hypothetical protein